MCGEDFGRNGAYLLCRFGIASKYGQVSQNHGAAFPDHLPDDLMNRPQSADSAGSQARGCRRW
jgi:hypothetical protein